MSSPNDLSESTPRAVRLWLPQALLWIDRIVCGGLAIAASIPIAIALSIAVVFVHEAWIFFGIVPLGSFLTDTQWAPLFQGRAAGIVVIATATLMIAAIALLTAIPLGLLAAIYLAEYAPPMVRRVLKPSLEALSGVPTIVFGYFALLVVTPFLRQIIPQLSVFNALSAGLVTGVLITPIISSLSEDAIATVPRSLRDGAYAIGFTQREAIAKVILPAALPGIIAAITLAASRALGETMIAAIAGGQNPVLTANPLVPIESMTAFIVQVSLGDVAANSFVFHTVFTVGLVLFLITLALNWLGNWLVRRYRRAMAGLSLPHAESPHAAEDDQWRSLTIAPAPGNDPQHDSQNAHGHDLHSHDLHSHDLHSHDLDHTDEAGFPSMEQSIQPRIMFDQGFQAIALGGALVGVIVLAIMLSTVLHSGLPQIDWQFLTSFSSRKPEQAGILSALAGTLWLMMLTALLAFPIGIGAAIYLEEYVPETTLSYLLESHLANMAAVPSILYGLLGLALFVRSWAPVTGGRTLLSAALALAVLILPMLIITTRNALRSVPQRYREAAYATGMMRWQVIYYVLLPTAWPSILTGMLLALSRAIGETAPLVAMGAAAFISFAPGFSWDGVYSSFTTLPTQIFYWLSRPQPEFQNLAAASILVLGALVLALNIVAVLLRDSSRQRLLP